MVAEINIVKIIIAITNNGDENNDNYTAQKMKFSVKDFFSKCDQLSSFLLLFIYFTISKKCDTIVTIVIV